MDKTPASKKKENNKFAKAVGKIVRNTIRKTRKELGLKPIHSQEQSKVDNTLRIAPADLLLIKAFENLHYIFKNASETETLYANGKDIIALMKEYGDLREKNVLEKIKPLIELLSRLEKNDYFKKDDKELKWIKRLNEIKELRSEKT